MLLGEAVVVFAQGPLVSQGGRGRSRAVSRMTVGLTAWNPACLQNGNSPVCLPGCGEHQMRTFQGSGTLGSCARVKSCMHSLPQGLLCMLYVYCACYLPFYVRDSAWESRTACTFGLTFPSNLWDGDPHFPVFFPPRPSSVLCDIAKITETQTPTSRASPLRCVSISFLAPLSLVAQTLPAAPDLQAVPGSSFISPICSPTSSLNPLCLQPG